MATSSTSSSIPPAVQVAVAKKGSPGQVEKKKRRREARKESRQKEEAERVEEVSKEMEVEENKVSSRE